MATCRELYVDTLGGLDLDGSTDKNLPCFVVENLATLYSVPSQCCFGDTKYTTVIEKLFDLCQNATAEGLDCTIVGYINVYLLGCC